MDSDVLMDKANSLDHWKTVLAAVLMSAASAAIFLLLPMLIGSMVESLGLSEEAAGYTVAAYFAGYTLVCLSGYFWIRKVHWQLLTALGYGLLIGGLLVAGFFPGNGLAAIMFITGIGAGILLGLGVTLISDMRNPDRTFGWQMLAQQAFPALMLFSLPVLLDSTNNFSNLTTSIAIALSALALSIAWVPAHGVKGNAIVENSAIGENSAIENVNFQWRDHWAVISILVCVAVYFAALSGVWAFVERMAAERDLSSAVIGQSLAIALVGGALGGIAAALIAGRIFRMGILSACTVAFLMVFWLYDTEFDLFLFTLASVIFSFVWNVCMAFQQGLVAALDRSGRFMVLVPSAIAAGAMIGPAVAGLTISGGSGYSLLLLIMGMVLLMATIPFILIAHKAVENTADVLDGTAQIAS